MDVKEGDARGKILPEGRGINGGASLRCGRAHTAVWPSRSSYPSETTIGRVAVTEPPNV